MVSRFRYNQQNLLTSKAKYIKGIIPMDLELAKRVGTAAAYHAGRVLRSHFGRISGVKKKGVVDLVTEADIASEKVVFEIIRQTFPDHDILGEESGLDKGGGDCEWIVDPLDGTTNFANQLGIFSVSIAFGVQGEILVGIVLNPLSRELFTAIKGKGALLNGRPIKVSNSKQVSESLLVTGFPYDFKKIVTPLLTRFTNCLKASLGVRRLGSAALDLCFVACGRFSGFWEQNLKPWDTAAGALIAQEAGARITDFSNEPFAVDKKEILATNGKIHKEMLALLQLKDRE
jgi:myo-inositol-1(or 4)-monophosphatase